MILVNELKITPDNKCLVIDASIKDLDYLKGVTIDSIIVDTSETFIPTGPSDKALIIYNEDIKELDLINDASCRKVRIEVGKPFLNLRKSDIYFIYIIADISNAPEVASTPCGCHKERLMVTVANTLPIYEQLMNAAKELSLDCGNNQNFIDTFLRVLAIDANIKAGNYPAAIKYWNMFTTDNKHSKHHIKGCGCHGRH